MYRDIPEDLRRLVEPVVKDQGLELVDAELRRGANPWLLKLTIDTPEGEGRVSIGRCADVSREVSTQLDAHDFIPVPFRLEVSSPGLDRTLAREKDFEFAQGQEVRIETRRPLEGRRKFRGRLVAFEAGLLKLRVDTAEVEIPFDEVTKAHIIHAFTSSDFAPAKSGRKRRNKRA